MNAGDGSITSGVNVALAGTNNFEFGMKPSNVAVAGNTVWVTLWRHLECNSDSQQILVKINSSTDVKIYKLSSGNA